MHYSDFRVRLRDWDGEQFNAEVLESPVGEMQSPETVSFDVDALAHALRRLERKRIAPDELIELGEVLADALLPAQVREMLVRSLERVGDDAGVRLRLIVSDPELANLPWEYAYVQRVEEERGRDGFLLLDPRISLVRHDALAQAPRDTAAERPLTIVAAFAMPADVAPLDLSFERDVLKQALDDLDGVELQAVDHTTVPALENALVHGADIFHFAGHGTFEQGGISGAGSRGLGIVTDETSESAPAGARSGDGALVFEDDDGNHRLVPAENIGLTLRNAGVRMAVVGACESGRRDGVNVWSGVAPELMKNGLGACVAMQYEILDSAAIAFARAFYRAIAAGVTVDEAVADGRLAMLNAGDAEDVEWGVPVLYMRAPEGVVFPELAQDANLESQRRIIRSTLTQRVERLSGSLVGAHIGSAGDTDVDVTIEQDIDEIDEGGSATGLVIE